MRISPLAGVLLAACLFALVLLPLGCGDQAGNGGATELRFSAIPDSDKEKVTKRSQVIAAYLEKELGIPVSFVEAPDYNGAVQALVQNKVDLVWLGGVTGVLAEERTEGKARFICNRESDLQFKSHFIAHKDTGLAPVESLADMKEQVGALKFTFGSKSSTSGHIMPRFFLTDAGMIPEDTFGEVGFQAQGGHAACAKAVDSGAAQVGALNYKTFDKMKAAGELPDADIIFTTPPYVDYCMVGHERLGDELLGKVQAAFLKLDPANEEHKAVLEAFDAGSERFVAADPKKWDGIRAALKDARDRGLLE